MENTMHTNEQTVNKNTTKQSNDIAKIKVKILAKDLTKDFPRSPRSTIGGFIIAARALDKCRAKLANTIGEYHFNCPLDQMFFQFSGINPEKFEELVATGATDDEIAAYITQHSKIKDQKEIISFNNKHKDMNLSDLSPEMQVYFESYIAKYIPKNRIIYRWFDVYDIEEQRM
jgi:hypothetical protein